MRSVGDEMQTATQVFTPRSPGQIAKVLDLCMAPGGYSATTFKYNPEATVRGITLPLEQGGHPLLVKAPIGWHLDVKFLDITMLAMKFGVTEIPVNHPEGAYFSTVRLFPWETFDIVFCNGQVLRTHLRAEHCTSREPTRLIVSQLIFALQRIKKGGSLVVLLHKADAWPSVRLTYQMSRFAQVQLYKPRIAHTTRGSFYLIAKNVQPESEAGKKALKEWKETWRCATFGGELRTGETELLGAEVVTKVLDEFGGQYIELARSTWQIQADALSQTEYCGGGDWKATSVLDST